MPNFTLERAIDVRPRCLDWLWPGYLVRGKLAVLDGNPGDGQVAVDHRSGGPSQSAAARSPMRTGRSARDVSILISAEDGTLGYRPPASRGRRRSI